MVSLKLKDLKFKVKSLKLKCKVKRLSFLVLQDPSFN